MDRGQPVSRRMGKKFNVQLITQLFSSHSAVCPNNAVAYLDRTTNQPLACTLNAVNVCPGGNTCQTTLNSGLLYGYCCSGGTGSSGSYDDFYGYTIKHLLVGLYCNHINIRPYKYSTLAQNWCIIINSTIRQ